MTSSAKYQLIEMDDNLKYIFDNNNLTTLQIILPPYKEFLIDMKCLCWSSSSIQIKSSTLFDRLLQGSDAELAKVCNNSNNIAMFSVSQGNYGPYIAIKIENNVGIYCLKDVFLGASTSLSIETQPFPINDTNLITMLLLPVKQLMRRALYIKQNPTTNNTSSNNTLKYLFIQSDSTIMMKKLLINETINISYSCLIAITDTCTLTKVQISTNSYMYCIQVKGPGNVYFGVSGKRDVIRSYTTTNHPLLNNNRNRPPLIMMLFHSIVMLLVIGVIYVAMNLVPD